MSQYVQKVGKVSMIWCNEMTCCMLGTIIHVHLLGGQYSNPWIRHKKD